MRVITRLAVRARAVIRHARIFMARPMRAIAAGFLPCFLLVYRVSEVHAANLRTRARRVKAEVFPLGIKKAPWVGAGRLSGVSFKFAAGTPLFLIFYF